MSVIQVSCNFLLLTKSNTKGGICGRVSGNRLCDISQCWYGIQVTAPHSWIHGHIFPIMSALKSIETLSILVHVLTFLKGMYLEIWLLKHRFSTFTDLQDNGKMCAFIYISINREYESPWLHIMANVWFLTFSFLPS